MFSLIFCSTRVIRRDRKILTVARPIVARMHRKFLDGRKAL